LTGILLRLLGYWKHHWLAVILAYGCMFTLLALESASPQIIGYAIDSIVEIVEEGASGGTDKLILAAFFIITIYLVMGVFKYGQRYLGEYLSQHVAYDLRNSLYDKIQSLSFSFHDRSQTGQLMSRVTSDVEVARMFLSDGLLRLVLTIAQFIVIASILVISSWELALMMFLTLPLVMLISVKQTQWIRPIALRIQQYTGAYTAVLQEALAAIRVVKAFGAEEREYEKFRAANWSVRQETLKQQRINTFWTPAMTFILEMINVGIVVYGGMLVIDGKMSVGTLVEFGLYRQMLIQPVRGVGREILNAARAVGSGERIFEILDTSSEVIEKPDAYAMEDVRGRVVYENVGFGYGKDFPVITDINIDAQPGQTIALLGPIGSGKSTVLNLLPRFYDSTGGRILIDGHDIKDVTLQSLRANIGIVMQDVFLFNATIRDNIAYGRPDSTDEQIIEAAKIARIHDFIMSLPEGYETWVGERGITLSGGQKQRISIARTLLLDPKILVLDDSTSSVDMETEYLIQQALVELLKGRTAFVIAHRIRTVRNADQIIVLENGRIVEQGQHDDLIARGGFYKELYDVQLREQEELAKTASQTSGTTEEAGS
jgi:ATP-binding cassette subfamily B protein